MSIKQKYDMLYAPILAFILALGLIACILADSGAEVLFSSTTGECVRVVTDKDMYDCDNLPPRYKNFGSIKI